MMPFSGKLLLFRQKHQGGLLLLMSLSVICLAFSMDSHDDLDVARREILLRRIGHEILLQAGDSLSRVLPVKKIANNEYLLSFEKTFAFQPDSLVQTTRRLLAKDPLTSNYVVNVLNCADSGVAYGYAVSGTKKDDIISCLGRTQPKACYQIRIRFGPAATSTVKNEYLLGALALLAIAGYVILSRAKPQATVPQEQPAAPAETSLANQPPSATVFTLGAMSFDAEARKLMMNTTTIELTRTETRVLRIFATAPNEIIERSRLQKEIWEDEGVIVGRSLDMFISKLRKKLEPDPGLKLAVVRGKGYRLEISSHQNPSDRNEG